VGIITLPDQREELYAAEGFHLHGQLSFILILSKVLHRQWAFTLKFMMDIEAVDDCYRSYSSPIGSADFGYGTSSSRAGPLPCFGSVLQGQALERNGAKVGKSGLSPRFAISFSIAARPPPPSSSTSMRK